MRPPHFIQNLFRNSSKHLEVNEPSGDYIYIHEDDACQIELLPAENWSFLQMECKCINNFSENHFVGNGWSDIYIRPEPPSKLVDKKIIFQNFKIPFIEKGFLEKELRFSGMKRVPVNEIALVIRDFKFYCGLTNSFIDSIYFNHYIQPEYLDIYNSSLLEISNQYNLVLADWNKLEIYDTRSLSEVHRYNVS